jgi:tetratricopeptide (TPR) repeat protein
MNKLISVFILISTFSALQTKSNTIQSGNELLVIAENFKASNIADSAIKYFQRASVAFEAEKNIALFIHANNQAGILLTRQDKYEEAKTILKKSLIAVDDLTDSIQLLIATTYLGLGVAYGGEEDFENSLANHNKSLQIRLRILGPEHRDVATNYGNIGNIYFRKKEYDAAIDNHTKALHIRQKLFGEMGVEVIQSYANLGNAFREQKKFDTALNYFEKALAGKIAQVGEGHKELSRYYKSISDVYFLMKKEDLGDSYLKKSQGVSE